LSDPSADDYEYFLQASGDGESESAIVNRYRKYNGTDGNSPTEVSQTNRGRGGQPL